MSNDKNTGGSAFPTSTDQFGLTDASVHGGMTMRDYFAAKAMQAMCEFERPSDIRNLYGVAKQAYQYADSMLKAREQ